MDEIDKTAWIDEEKKILSFHAIENGKVIKWLFLSDTFL